MFKYLRPALVAGASPTIMAAAVTQKLHAHNASDCGAARGVARSHRFLLPIPRIALR